MMCHRIDSVPPGSTYLHRLHMSDINTAIGFQQTPDAESIPAIRFHYAHIHRQSGFVRHPLAAVSVCRDVLSPKTLHPGEKQSPRESVSFGRQLISPQGWRLVGLVLWLGWCFLSVQG